GNLVTYGNVNEIFLHEDIVQVAARDNNMLKQILTSYAGYTKLEEVEQNIEISFPAGLARLDEINAFCFEKGISLSHLQLRKKSLETKFFELTN
ncbi:MAG: ABC transporter ATP-binding protein, partial [Ferruginibacter sp.]